jgi:hypothetical protein
MTVAVILAVTAVEGKSVALPSCAFLVCPNATVLSAVMMAVAMCVATATPVSPVPISVSVSQPDASLIVLVKNVAMTVAGALVVRARTELCVQVGNALGARLLRQTRALAWILATGKTLAHQEWCNNMVNAWFHSQVREKSERVLPDVRPTLVELLVA